MIRRFILVSALSAVICGCANSGKALIAASPADAYARAEQGRVMIRSGSLDLRVKDLDDTKDRIEQIVDDVDGRIENWSLIDSKWLNMTLGVPEPRLDEAMERVAALGKVVGRSMRSRDVTEELIDLEARLKNLRALRDRLRTYLKQASNLEEILGVERELARVQSEIESIEARLKLLQDQIAMSELDVRVRRTKWF